MREVPVPPDLPPLTGSAVASLAAILELDAAAVPAPAEDHPDPWTVWRNWLAGRGMGMVPIADPAGFNWPGPWLAVLRGDGREVCAVAFGSPPGIAWHPLGGPETFAELERGLLVAPADVALWSSASAAADRTGGARRGDRRRRRGRGAGRAAGRGRRARRPRARGRPLPRGPRHVLRHAVRRPRAHARRGRGPGGARLHARRRPPQRRHARDRPQRARRPALPGRRGGVRRPPAVRAVRAPRAPLPRHAAPARAPRRAARGSARRRHDPRRRRGQRIAARNASACSRRRASGIGGGSASGNGNGQPGRGSSA